MKSSETTEKRLEIITCITKRERQREKAIETTDKCSNTYRYRDRNRQKGEDGWERERGERERERERERLREEEEEKRNNRMQANGTK